MLQSTVGDNFDLKYVTGSDTLLTQMRLLP